MYRKFLKLQRLDANIYCDNTQLLSAAEKRDKVTVEYLINAGVDINCSHSYNDWTLLHYASRNGWFKIVQYLLNVGVDIELKTQKSESSMLLAAEHGHKDIVELLINAGADINCSHSCNNWKVLHYACKNGWFDIVQSLLNKGADIQLKTRGGASPLLLAAENGHKDIFELLVNAGSDLNCSRFRNNWKVLDYISNHEWFDSVRSLLNRGKDIQLKTRWYDSSLLWAAENSHKDIVELLINAGADINCSTRWSNFTVLHFASANGWSEIVESLLKKGVDIEAKSDGGTSLQMAFNSNQIEIVEQLINAGADYNIEYRDWDSPDVILWFFRKMWATIFAKSSTKCISISCIVVGLVLIFWQIAFEFENQ